MKCDPILGFYLGRTTAHLLHTRVLQSKALRAHSKVAPPRGMCNRGGAKKRKLVCHVARQMRKGAGRADGGKWLSDGRNNNRPCILWYAAKPHQMSHP